MRKIVRLTLLIACVWTRTQFTLAQTASLPAAVNKPSLTYMPTLGGSILFGGYPRRGTPLSETWLLKNGCWQKLSVKAPPPRAGHGAAYDAKRKKLVIFGGHAGDNQPLNDTWEFNGKKWSKASSDGPAARALTRMVYDATRKRVVLIGGRDGRPSGGIFGDAWEWNGRSWKQIPVSGFPSRFEHAAAHDGKRKAVVVFGGNNATDRNFGQRMMGDTWVLRKSSWTEITGDAPAKRDHHAMAQHQALGVTLLFGGAAGRDFLGDTWTFDGKSWQHLDDVGAPSPRGGVPAMTYDSDRKKVIMYGGWGKDGPHQDVWEWDRKWNQVLATCTPPTS